MAGHFANGVNADQTYESAQDYNDNDYLNQPIRSHVDAMIYDVSLARIDAIQPSNVRFHHIHQNLA